MTVGVLALTAALLVASTSQADRFEKGSTREISLPGDAVDLALDPGGNWTFILLSGGRIAVYDGAGKLVQTLQVERDYDHIRYDSRNSRLVLAGPGQELKIIALAMRFDIDPEGSPYRGDPGAPVTIAVYSDFQ